MFLGLGVESRGRQWEGQEGSTTQASSCSFGSAVSSSTDLSPASGPPGHHCWRRRAAAATPTHRHHTRLFRVAVVLSFPWEASLLPVVPPAPPCSVRGDAALCCAAQLSRLMSLAAGSISSLITCWPSL